jgi:hypothetical protein
MDRCPLLEELRGTPPFLEARRRIYARATAIWTP